MLLDQAHRAFTYLKGKLVVLAHGSILSRNEASSKPGVIQSCLPLLFVRCAVLASVGNGFGALVLVLCFEKTLGRIEKCAPCEAKPMLAGARQHNTLGCNCAFEWYANKLFTIIA